MNKIMNSYSNPVEFKVVELRECSFPTEQRSGNTAEMAAEYWYEHIASTSYFNPECECLAIIILNTRRMIKGHQLVSIGTQETILVHPREIFRCAIVAAANAILMMHNHPSGDPTPSSADVTATRDLVRAGQLLRIAVLDHVIVGFPRNIASLRELGLLE